MSSTSRRLLRTILAIVVIAGIFFFMGRSLYHNWGQLKDQLASLHFNPWLLPLPFVAYGLAFVTGAFGWKKILSHFGEQISLKRSVQIIAYAQFGHYLPGKVWAWLGRVYLAKESGVAERHSALSVIIETAFLLVTATAMFAAALPTASALPPNTYWLLLLLPLMLVFLYPPIFNWLVNLMLRAIKQPPAQFRIGLRQALVIFLIYFLSWALQGTGLYLLVSSFYPLALQQLLYVSGAFALSWIIGFVVIIAPGGFGVREGLFAVLMKPILSGTLNIVASLISRLWVALSEVMVFLVVFVFFRLRRSNVIQEETRNEEIRS